MKKERFSSVGWAMKNKNINFRESHGMNDEEMCKKVCNINVVNGEQVFQPESILSGEGSSVKIIGNHSKEMFFLDTLVNVSGMNFDELFNNVLSDISKLFEELDFNVWEFFFGNPRSLTYCIL
jgi:hypothetical protein